MVVPRDAQVKGESWPISRALHLLNRVSPPKDPEKQPPLIKDVAVQVKDQLRSKSGEVDLLNCVRASELRACANSRSKADQEKAIPRAPAYGPPWGSVGKASVKHRPPFDTPRDPEFTSIQATLRNRPT